VNGYQSGCTGVSFSGTFGTADQVMQRDGRVSLFFNNCTVGDNNTAIEELGNGLRRFIDGLRYTDGQAVPQVDVVAHSMGGLIARSYIAGKQTAAGVFTPPLDTKIRKLVFLGSPHFGTPVAGGESNRQTQQMVPGNAFLFDLATWNQGRDDLRGADVITVLGNAGIATIVPWAQRFHDTTVSLMSGSLGFVPAADSTRIINACHTSGFALAGCVPGVETLAGISSDQHLSGRMIRSFLNATNEWRTLGDAPAANPFLDAEAGLMLQWRDNNDRPLTVDRAEARTESAGATFSALDLRNSGTVAYAETFSAAPLEVRATSGQTQTTVRFTPTAGSFNTQVFKPGPFLNAVVPVFQPVTPRAVAPGMFITLWGTLAPVTEAASGQPYPTTLGQTQVLLADRPLPLHYVSPTQINALLPDNISGLIKLTIRTPAGQHTTNVVVENAVPSVYQTAVSAITGALITRDAPTRRGDYITVYVTGLGLADPGQAGLLWSRQQPTVQIGNVECIVGFAGRHSVYAGLDQINCQIPGSSGTGDLNLTVKSGSRTADPIVVPVR
jgi:uncharacterized protein (TIGR03437 family)